MADMDNTFDFNPMTGRDRQNLFTFYTEARERPITFSPSMGAFMVSRYADIPQNLLVQKLFSLELRF